MTKLKGAGILGAMVIAGVTLLTSFPASSASSFLSLRTWRLEKACLSATTNPDLCKIVARLADRLGRPEAATEADLAYAVRKMRGPVQRYQIKGCCDCADTLTCDPNTCLEQCADVDGGRCAKCVSAVSTIEARLATNGTAALLADTIGTACDGRFADPAATQSCKDQINGAVPVAIDKLLANLPPLTLCQGLYRRACAP